MAFAVSSEENKIIDGCLANDRLSQRALYDRYKRAMYTIAYRITGDFHYADDVLQDAFIQIFKGLPKFRRESTLGAWIKTIVIRAALRKIKKRPLFDPIEVSQPEEPVDWGDFLNAEYLERAIKNLPDGYRTVFVLIEVEGYKHREVAEMLEISAGTSKSQLFHAKKLLRQRLANYDHGYGR